MTTQDPSKAEDIIKGEANKPVQSNTNNHRSENTEQSCVSPTKAATADSAVSSNNSSLDAKPSSSSTALNEDDLPVVKVRKNVDVREFNWKKDFKRAAQMVYDVWFFDVKDHRIGYLCGVYFLLHYLRHSTSIEVAVNDNDEMIGILGLTNKKDTPVLSLKRFLNYKASIMEKIALLSIYSMPSARDTRLFDGLFFANYAKLRKMVPCKDAPEFLVLISDPKARGLGVGRTLMEVGENILRKQGFKEYYLLTDSSCDYAFYDKIGMDKVVDVSMSFNINHVEDYDHYLNCYLRGLVYVKKL